MVINHRADPFGFVFFVVALSLISNSALASPVFDLWYGTNQRFADLGEPQRQVNILGNVSDPDGIDALRYSLNGAASKPLSIGPRPRTPRRLVGPGDFNVELLYSEILDGQNSIVLTATDGLGLQATETILVNYSSGNVWPLPYAIDWSTVGNIQDVAQIVDGLWSVVGSGIRTTEPGYDRIVAIGDMSWGNYVLTVPVTVHGIDPACVANIDDCRGSPAVSVLARWTGHYDWNNAQPEIGYYPIGTAAGYYWSRSNLITGDQKLRGGEFQTLAEDATRILPFGVTHIFKLRAETTPGIEHTYSFKMWEQGQPEPAGWDLVGVEPVTSTALANGSALLIAHNVDASFGNVAITPVTTGAPRGPVAPDDFNDAVLDTDLWTVIDPVGDATVSMTGSQVSIAVPAGVEHPVWNNGNLSPRLMQEVNDDDFEVEAKFDSQLTGRYQSQGILVEQDSGNFVRFDFNQDGTGSTTRIFSAIYIDGNPVQQVQADIATGVPQYLRVSRVGNQWTQMYSYDGLNWLTAGSFTHNLLVTSIGLFAANDDAQAPAYTVLIDDFAVTGGVPVDTTPPVISAVQATSVTSSEATISWQTDEPADSSVAYGLNAGYGAGSVSDPGLVTSHNITLTDLTPGTLYHYQVRSEDASGNQASSDDFTFTTLPPAPNVPPTAAFSFSTSGLTASFTDTSSDSDGSVSSWSWSFGDDGTSSTTNPSHTYAAAGTYNVTLTVTDNDGGSNSVTQPVTVTAPGLLPAAPTNLTAIVESSGRGKNKVVTSVQLNWTDNSGNEEFFVIERCQKVGKGSSKTCIYSELATVGANITSFFDSPGSGIFRYRVKARNAHGDSAYSNSIRT